MPTFDLLIDAHPGIGTMAIEADDNAAAWAEARRLFPGYRLALVSRDDDEAVAPSPGQH